MTNLKTFDISVELKKCNFYKPFDCMSKSKNSSIELHYVATSHFTFR